MSERVSIAVNNAEIGGGEVMALAIAEALRDLGRDAAVVAPQGSSVLEEALRREFAVVGIRGSGRAQYMANLRRWDARAWRGLLWCNGLVPALATAGHRNRVVHLHQMPRTSQSPAVAIARLKAVKTVVPSRFMAEKLPGSEVLWNWVPQVRKQRRTWASSVVTLGFLGRTSLDKGIGVLADALKLLERSDRGRFRLLIAGEPLFLDAEERRQVESALSRIAPLIERAGWIGREEFFQRTDLAVFPSVVEESFGLVVAEAMSAGVPFVITDAGALPEVAGAGYPWVARTGDAESLAETIRRAWSGYGSAELDASRQRWANEFSPEAGRERLGLLLSGLER